MQKRFLLSLGMLLSGFLLCSNVKLFSSDESMCWTAQEECVDLVIANQSSTSIVAFVKTKTSTPHFYRIEIPAEQHWGPILICKNAETSLRTESGDFLLLPYKDADQEAPSLMLLSKYPVDGSESKAQLQQAIKALPYNEIGSIILILNADGTASLTSVKKKSPSPDCVTDECMASLELQSMRKLQAKDIIHWNREAKNVSLPEVYIHSVERLPKKIGSDLESRLCVRFGFDPKKNAYQEVVERIQEYFSARRIYLIARPMLYHGDCIECIFMSQVKHIDLKGIQEALINPINADSNLFS